MDRAIARVKRKHFQPVTKFFNTTTQRRHECTTQHEMLTACIIKYKKRLSQIFDTPPVFDELIELIGYDTKKRRE